MIEIRIEKALGAFSLDIDLTLPADGISALFGASGAGKSSILNAVAGLLRPDTGRIALGERVLFDSSRGIDTPVRNRRLGVVFQDGRLFPHMTVRSNLLYGTPADGTAAPPAFDDVVDLLGVSHLLDRRPGDLSGGERQRVAIGRALLMKPDVLLMDEPLAALDGARKAEILPMLSELRALRRIPILYVSHQMDEVVRLADTLVLVDGGRIAAMDSVEALTSRLDLRHLTGRHEAGSVLRGTVTGSDTEWGLTELSVGGAKLFVSTLGLERGTPVRLRIRARDVAIALTPPEDASFLNMLPATVAEIAEADGASLDISLALSDAPHAPRLWARITRRSADRLGLRLGLPVHALLKTVGIDRHTLAGPHK
ncbi:MAG: molybdenum ABC transporter ATP-binding protein [Alphaproteobacteria bacterium]|nr:molybdenum ABC transporter ATP-binding protein [Alphaproteobacteria bacterium]